MLNKNAYGVVKSSIDYYQNKSVTVNGQESPWTKIHSGGPQGLVLGPLLFLLYVNDLPDNLLCSPKLFADDVSLNEHINVILNG